MRVKLLETDSVKNHFFAMSWAANSKDIVIVQKRGHLLEAYLTDKTYTLRAAAIVDDEGARLITNEKALKKFKAELSLFAKEAADLPPTTTEDKQPVKK